MEDTLLFKAGPPGEGGGGVTPRPHFFEHDQGGMRHIVYSHSKHPMKLNADPNPTVGCILDPHRVGVSECRVLSEQTGRDYFERQKKSPGGGGGTTPHPPF